MRSALFALLVMFAAAPALADDRALNRIVADYEAYSLKDDPYSAGQQGVYGDYGLRRIRSDRKDAATFEFRASGR